MLHLKRFEIALVIALIVCVLVNIVGFCRTGNELSKDVLRLHIIANSDMHGDQQVKILVRNAILKEGSFVFDGVHSRQEAQIKIKEHLSFLEAVADRVIRENGYDYHSNAFVANDYFETRYYADFTMPAGEYTALKIVLGEGKGKNWWCVMYPQLCLGAAGKKAQRDLNSHEKKVIFSNPHFEVRFKCVEVYQNIKNFIKNNKK